MVSFTSFVFISTVIGTSANTIIPKPACDSNKEVSVRYASSSQRIYVESLDGTRGGCTSLTHIYETLGADKSPLFPLDTPGEWYLGNELYVLDGITLEVHGTASGGDCDFLKMKSDSESFVYIRGHGASLDFVNTHVSSWDMTSGTVDTNIEDGRAYLSAISEVLLDTDETCQGVAKNNMGESRMDIKDSEISYLGYNGSESWGISWKIRGLCNDLSNEDEYSGFGVYGNIYDSDIHHLYYGHYSYRHLNGAFIGNKVHDNEVYGFDPHHGSINLTISDNEVFNNGNHGIIFSKWCSNVIVDGNHVYDNEGVGIFPHWLGDGAVISNNLVENNGDSGIAFLESSGGSVFGNTVVGNVHGIRFSVGSRDNVVYENVFENNSGYDVYTYEGSDAVVELPDKIVMNNVIFNNVFRGNEGGFRFDSADTSQFLGNSVSGAKEFDVRDTSVLVVYENTFPDDMVFSVSNSCIQDTIESTCGVEVPVFDGSDGSLVSSVAPSVTPTVVSSVAPTVVSSVAPTVASSVAPTVASSVAPTVATSVAPTVATSVAPSVTPNVSVTSSMSSTNPRGFVSYSSVSPTGSPTGIEIVDSVDESSTSSSSGKFGKSVSFVLIIVGVVTIIVQI